MTVMIDGLASAVWPEDVQRLHTGLRDALQLYDRVAGNIRADHGWTAADVKRLAEIRALVSKS